MLVGERFNGWKSKKKSNSVDVCDWFSWIFTEISEYFDDHCLILKKEIERYFRLNLFKLSKGARWFFRSQSQFKFRSKGEIGL